MFLTERRIWWSSKERREEKEWENELVERRCFVYRQLKCNRVVTLHTGQDFCFGLTYVTWPFEFERLFYLLQTIFIPSQRKMRRCLVIRQVFEHLQVFKLCRALTEYTCQDASSSSSSSSSYTLFMFCIMMNLQTTLSDRVHGILFVLRKLIEIQDSNCLDWSCSFQTSWRPSDSDKDFQFFVGNFQVYNHVLHNDFVYFCLFVGSLRKIIQLSLVGLEKLLKINTHLILQLIW